MAAVAAREGGVARGTAAAARPTYDKAEIRSRIAFSLPGAAEAQKRLVGHSMVVSAAAGAARMAAPEPTVTPVAPRMGDMAAGAVRKAGAVPEARARATAAPTETPGIRVASASVALAGKVMVAAAAATSAVVAAAVAAAITAARAEAAAADQRTSNRALQTCMCSGAGKTREATASSS